MSANVLTKKPTMAVVDGDARVREAAEAVTTASAAYRAAGAKVADLQRVIQADRSAVDRSEFLQASLMVRAAEEVVIRAELDLDKAKKRHEAVRAAAVAERAPVCIERMKAAVMKLDEALERAREADQGVIEAWRQAEETLGVGQRIVPSDLRWAELLPESPSNASRLDTWRRYCERYEWL